MNSELPLFPAQVVYQHLEAYLEALGLTACGITTAAFFDPTQFASPVSGANRQCADRTMFFASHPIG